MVIVESRDCLERQYRTCVVDSLGLGITYYYRTDKRFTE